MRHGTGLVVVGSFLLAAAALKRRSTHRHPAIGGERIADFLVGPGTFTRS